MYVISMKCWIKTTTIVMDTLIGLTVSEMSTATFRNAVQRGLARISSNTPLERDR